MREKALVFRAKCYKETVKHQTAKGSRKQKVVFAVVLRVDHSSHEQMKLVVKKFFASKFQTKPKKSACTSPVPPGSVFLKV